ncbi:hypothetical protein [Halobacterium zhouii]|uniref:hypothetical protein n=1 Tax=Halobacterium zhouii TaxID=2902624 RepID=UPI001E59CFFE|nr:hypothetical protein [Halobacterium zhouii]
MTESNYRVVSERKRAGELLDLPEGANNVSVEPADTAGYVTVTYLKPMLRVPFRDDGPLPYVE